MQMWNWISRECIPWPACTLSLYVYTVISMGKTNLYQVTFNSPNPTMPTTTTMPTQCNATNRIWIKKPFCLIRKIQENSIFRSYEEDEEEAREKAFTSTARESAEIYLRRQFSKARENSWPSFVPKWAWSRLCTISLSLGQLWMFLGVKMQAQTT